MHFSDFSLAWGIKQKTYLREHFQVSEVQDYPLFRSACASAAVSCEIRDMQAVKQVTNKATTGRWRALKLSFEAPAPVNILYANKKKEKVAFSAWTISYLLFIHTDGCQRVWYQTQCDPTSSAVTTAINK